MDAELRIILIKTILKFDIVQTLAVLGKTNIGIFKILNRFINAVLEGEKQKSHKYPPYRI